MAPGGNTSKYLALFVAESTEHLEALGRDLVELEKQRSAEVVNSMFRHAHSVKGMAAAMAFESTALLAHRLEDFLAAVRSDVARFDAGHGDLVLQTSDVLLAHVKSLGTGGGVTEVGELVGKLSDALSRLKGGGSPAPSAPPPPKPSLAPPPPVAPAPPAPAPTAAAAPPDLSLPPRYALKLRVSPASAQPGVRGFLAYKRLSTLGNVFNLKPPIEEVKAGKLPEGLVTLELETEQSEANIAKTLAAIAEVELLSLGAVVIGQAKVAPKPAEPEGARPLGQEPARTVRVKTELLDTLLDAAGELLLATARVREVGKVLPELFRPPLEDEVDRLHALVRGLHDKVMEARMTPIGVVTDRLPRAARDIARRRGREVELTITGADIELDRAIVDELADPVLHLLRNAIDHGIETPQERVQKGKPEKGRVGVTVRRAHDRVVLEVEDDGKGIDGEKLKALAVERGLVTEEDAKAMSERDALLLCALPGLSTASDVTDISGRGVGMDAVKRAVEAVGGSLDVESRLGRGTRFRLSLPLTVAMVNLLLVGVGDDVYGLPIAKVVGVVETSRSSLPHSEKEPVLGYGAAVIPVHELSELLQVPGLPKDKDRLIPLVVAEADQGKVALSVDRLHGQQEVVLKGLARPLDLVPGLAGVTILGNGRPVFILDVARLVTA